MNVHPLTLDYLGTVATRPGMFMRDFDLRQLELQLYGFDAGLAAAGVLGNFERFNRSFAAHLESKASLPAPQGWAQALLATHGQSEATFQIFLSLVASASSGTTHTPDHSSTP